MKSFYRFNYGGYELSSSEEVSAVDGGTGTAGATGSQATEVSKPVSRLERYLAYKAKQLAERKVSIGVLTSYGERKTKRFGFATVMDKSLKEHDESIVEGALSRPEGNLYFQSVAPEYEVPFIKEVCSRSSVVIDIDTNSLLSFSELCPSQLETFNANEDYSKELRGYLSTLIVLAQPYLSLTLGAEERARREQELYEKNRKAKEAELAKARKEREALLETPEGIRGAISFYQTRLESLPEQKKSLEEIIEDFEKKLAGLEKDKK